MSPDQPTHLRVGTADREDAVARLQHAAAEGRLTHDELGERVGAALAAKTWGDLSAVLSDLGGLGTPTAPVGAGLAVPAARVGTWSVRAPYAGPGWRWDDPLVLRAQWDSVKRVGAWQVPPFLEVTAFGDNVYLSCLHATPLAPVIDVQVMGGAGRLTLVLPDGWGADLSRVERGLGSLKTNVPALASEGGVQFVVRGKNPLDGVFVRTPTRRDLRRLERARRLPGGVLAKG